MYNQRKELFKPLAGHVHNFSINQVHQLQTYQNALKLLMSDREFELIHKFLRVTVQSINNAKDTNTHINST